VRCFGCWGPTADYSFIYAVLALSEFCIGDSLLRTAARTEGRIGGRRKKLDDKEQRGSPKASFRDGSPTPKWLVSTASASRPFHEPLLNIEQRILSVQF